MNLTQHIPCRTSKGERIVTNEVGWLTTWERIYRQVFILSNGYRSVERIALLLKRPAELIAKICRELTVNGYISLQIEKRILVMDAQLLKASFEEIPDRTQFARRFYEILFDTFPDSHALFARTNWNRQYSSLMATLASVVSGVERGENVVPSLHKLGERHARYGAQPDHYPIVGASLIATFKQILGPAFTQEMQDAWTSAFEVISTEMIQGAIETGTL
ncbi:MAG TPA: globin domain-containing protein [Ktedonobacteraceae bacterium]|nr:globin domain-containing protein [Ktedonobacteraceae bacterium]